MASDICDLSRSELFALLAGDPRPRARLAAGEQLRAETPFRYPGRRGPVIVYLIPGPALAGAPSEAPSPPTPGRVVRISDGGALIKSLDEQGMDLAIDMILSKTVFHAVKQQAGGGVAAGQVYLDSTTETVTPDLWRFLQLVAEIIGLRHSKYKEALTQLSRRQERAPDLIGWEDR